MRINFRNILYNYFRNIFLRVLRNAWETGSGIAGWAVGQHATTAALLIAIVASILTRYARASTRYSMHKRGHHEHLHGGHQSVAAGWSTYTTTRLLSGYALYNLFNNYPLNKVTKLFSNVFWNMTADAVSNLKRAFRRKRFTVFAFFQIFFQWNVHARDMRHDNPEQASPSTTTTTPWLKHLYYY